MIGDAVDRDNYLPVGDAACRAGSGEIYTGVAEVVPLKIHIG